MITICKNRTPPERPWKAIEGGFSHCAWIPDHCFSIVLYFHIFSPECEIHSGRKPPSSWGLGRVTCVLASLSDGFSTCQNSQPASIWGAVTRLGVWGVGICLAFCCEKIHPGTVPGSLCRVKQRWEAPRDHFEVPAWDLGGHRGKGGKKELQ